MATQKYTQDHIIAVLVETRGTIWPAAQKLGCDEGTIRNYAKRYPRVAQTIQDQRERLVDSAEVRLAEAVEKRGEPWAIMFTLKTLGKPRGYVEKTQQEISIPDGITVTAKQDFDVDHYIEQRRSLPGGTSGPRLLGANGSDESVDTPHPNGKAG